MNNAIKSLLQSPENERFYQELPLPITAGAWGPKVVKTPMSRRRGTWANAVALQKLLRFRLKKYAGSSAPAQVLRNVLEDCGEGQRCCDPACALCNYATQCIWAELLKEFIEVGIRLDCCLTIIARGRILPENEKGGRVVARARKRLDDAFDEAKVSMIVGGFDFDFSEFPDKEFKDHCRPHFHGLGVSVECDRGEPIIRRRFPAKGSVFKPVEIVPFDSRENWLRYSLKIPNTRKIRPRSIDAANGSVLQAPPKYKTLRVEQHLQQAFLLQDLGWSGRFYLRGVELKKSNRGHWRLVSCQASTD